MGRIIALLTACIVAACSAEQPSTATAPKLETGITSSNGGGQRQLDNTQSIGVTTPTTPAK